MLVGKREVYLERGSAYVPLQRLVSIIVTRFRMNLSRALAEAANSFDIVGSDSRIGPLLKVCVYVLLCYFVCVIVLMITCL
jgi:DNA primase large subunit